MLVPIAADGGYGAQFGGQDNARGGFIRYRLF